jgi:hypothetical protein
MTLETLSAVLKPLLESDIATAEFMRSLSQDK